MAAIREISIMLLILAIVVAVAVCGSFVILMFQDILSSSEHNTSYHPFVYLLFWTIVVAVISALITYAWVS